MIWLLLLAASPDGGRICKPPAADMQVKVAFKAGATVDDLARFASAILCEPWNVSAAERKRVLKISIEGEVSARQLPALFRLLTESAGVVRVEAPPPPAPTPCKPKLVATILPVDPWTRKVPAASKDQLVECVPFELRAVLSLKDDKPQGFKLFGIRPGSVGEALALQNGDVVLAVNGSEISAPDRALEAYVKLKDATDLKVSIVRKGEPRTITWLIR